MVTGGGRADDDPAASGRAAYGRAAYEAAAGTPDPELPMLTVADLGILRAVDVTGAGVTVTITPTYSGCPAMREIGADIRQRLERAGFAPVTVATQLAPAWTSDAITAEGRRKLAAAGIAPPSAAPRRTGPVPLTLSFGPPGGRRPWLPRLPALRLAPHPADGAVQRHRVQVAAPLRGLRRALRDGEGTVMGAL